MASTTIGFSIPAEDQERLDRLVKRFGHGNRSAFLRAAMTRMEVLERAERLQELQRLGVQSRSAAGLDDVSVDEIVHRVLGQTSSP
jgi:Arc/MetJ-type ribon-helix-helix transcriptional regulator